MAREQWGGGNGTSGAGLGLQNVLVMSSEEAQPPLPQSSQEWTLTTSQALCPPRSLCLSHEARSVLSAEAPLMGCVSKVTH